MLHASRWLLLWQIAGSLLLAPHFLTFYNEIAGGADNGWRFLADSNSDWGQTLKALAAYQQEQQLGPVKLSQFTFLDPATYGVDYVPIAPMTGAPPVLPQRFNPAAGLYAISATTLDGVPLPYPPTFDWFRHREPFTKIAHAMFLYDVQPTAGKWLAQCTTPVAPLTPEAIAEGFGDPTLRHITFDCGQSWVIPGDGSGWYARAIPAQEQLRWPRRPDNRLDLWPAWARAYQTELALSYLQPTAGTLPPFAIWECDACFPQPEESQVELAGTLAFLEIVAPQQANAGDTVDILTLWRVLARPEHPLSLMLHLRGTDGVPIAVGDGLGFAVEQWQPGDLLVQRHALTIPPETAAGTYTVQTGAYWLETLQPLNSNAPPEVLAKSLVIK